MKNLSVIALVLAISGVSFAQAKPTTAPATVTTTTTTTATTQEKTAEPCKGLEGAKLQDCTNAQKAKGTTQPTATSKPAQPAQQN